MQIKNIDIKNLTKKELEYIIESLLKKMNFDVIYWEENSEGIEYNVVYKNPVLGGNYLILLKKTESSVGESTVKYIYDKVESENYTKGIIFTNETFTNKARRYVDKVRVELIDNQKLKELLQVNKINVDEQIKLYKTTLLEGYVTEKEDRENREKIFVDCSIENDEIKKIRRLLRENRRGLSVENLELRIEIVKWLIIKFDKLVSLVKRNNVMNEIVENYNFILENPFVINDNLENDLSFKIKLIQDSIDIRKGEFSEILSRNIEISKCINEIGIKKLEVELFKIINIIRIVELCKEEKRAEELISIIDEKLNSDLNEKKIALRETDFEIRKSRLEFEKFLDTVDKELGEKLGIIHYKSLELFNKVIQKQIKDIELLNKELNHPGYIKSFNLFSKKKTNDELKKMLEKMEEEVDKSEFYKQKIIESYMIGENKSLIEYKEKVLIEIFNKILDCKVEKEIINHGNFNKDMRISCWDSIDSIISKFDILEEVDVRMLNFINVPKVEYPNEIITLVKETREGAYIYISELENLYSNLNNQVKYLNNLIDWFQIQLCRNTVYLFNFDKFASESNLNKESFFEIEIDEFIKTIERDLLKEETKKIKALMGIYRFV